MSQHATRFFPENKDAFTIAGGVADLFNTAKYQAESALTLSNLNKFQSSDPKGFERIATKINIIRTDGGMSDVQYKLLSDFIQLKKINITEEHRPYSSSFIGEYTPYIQDDIIMMFSHNYIDAILKIQAQWRKCRYNQQYYLCRKIMDDNYTNIVN